MRFASRTTPNTDCRRRIFTRDIAKGIELAKRMETGICHINGPTVHDEAQMPFGGVKASGYGRFGGKAGIDAFTETALDHGAAVSAALSVLGFLALRAAFRV